MCLNYVIDGFSVVNFNSFLNMTSIKVQKKSKIMFSNSNIYRDFKHGFSYSLKLCLLLFGMVSVSVSMSEKWYTTSENDLYTHMYGYIYRVI